MGIVYTRHPLQLGRVEWPDEARDRPLPGSFHASGDPLCSVHVSGPDTDTTLERLRWVSDGVQALVKPFEEAA